MPHIYHRLNSNFNEDWFEEVEDIIETINDKNCKLAVRAILVKHRLDKNEAKINFLTQWMRALNNSYVDLKESIELVEFLLSENEQKLSDLTEEFNKLKVK